MIAENIQIAENGHLLFAGQDTVNLAEKYGTPLYLLDEDLIRANCRKYQKAFSENFGNNSEPLYASKANSFKRIYQIMTEENMGIDVVSSGEIYTAIQAGYDMSHAYFHSNNKTDQDIKFAMHHGIRYFVVDNTEEIRSIQKFAAAEMKKQKILLRLTPGIDPHTYEEVSTGKVDSKFGSAIETGQAEGITRFALKQPNIELAGFHCHIGSQVFTEDVFERAATVMIDFAADMRDKYGYTAEQIDLGGGYGVRYLDSDPFLDVEKKVAEVASAVRTACNRRNFPMPAIHMEPGRSIVGAAGMTLYTCGSVKKIPGYKNYVSIDGGMPDNPRHILYGSQYTCYPASHMNVPRNMICDLVGRCCESGDIISTDITMPADIHRGDLVAVCTTGAYNYSMASNYNRIPRPPIVMLKDGDKQYIAVRRESLEDLCRNDL